MSIFNTDLVSFNNFGNKNTPKTLTALLNTNTYGLNDITLGDGTGANNANTDEGGRLTLGNSKKTADNTKIDNWVLFNMTGGYGDGLHFYRYSGGSSSNNANFRNRGTQFVLLDNGTSEFRKRADSTGNLKVEGNLQVNGASTLGGGLTIAGASTLGGGLTVAGSATLSSTLNVTGAATIDGGLSVNANNKFVDDNNAWWKNNGTGSFVIRCKTIDPTLGCLKIETTDYPYESQMKTFSTINSKGRLHVYSDELILLMARSVYIHKRDDIGATGNLLVQGELSIDGALRVSTWQQGRIHINSTTDHIHLLAKGNVIVDKNSGWGTSGNLVVHNDLAVEGNASIAGQVIIHGSLQVRANLHVSDYISCNRIDVSDIINCNRIDCNVIYINGNKLDGLSNIFTDTWRWSDRRLKENIKNVSQNEKDKVLQLVPKSFNMIADDKKRKRYGLIAQEVEELYPELVLTDEKGMKSLNYMDLIPLLLEQIKELKRSIPNPNVLNTNVLNIGGVSLTANELLKLKQLIN